MPQEPIFNPPNNPSPAPGRDKPRFQPEADKSRNAEQNSDKEKSAADKAREDKAPPEREQRDRSDDKDQAQH